MDKGKGIVEEPASKGLRGHGSVIQDPVVVTISRKGILKEIMDQLGATIRTEGVYKLSESKWVAWVTVEIPPKEGEGAVEVEAFQGIPCMTDYEAQENVSEIAIAHFISQMNINVNDVNYVSFLETYRQWHHCMSWSQVLQIKYETMRIEKSRLFNAHVELLKRLSSICVRHNDILPLASCDPLPQSASICTEQVMYTGSKPPVTRHELLARELFNILQENTPNGSLLND
ncbi:unnamed protein product [Urochloa decumbens]|uniref:Uncharacterized protein n=1 Tax=Urochloa decumbens TaxID=240449 RepID=A0ABC9FGD4_9POAL